jgi:hypothetical protein
MIKVTSGWGLPGQHYRIRLGKNTRIPEAEAPPGIKTNFSLGDI